MGALMGMGALADDQINAILMEFQAGLAYAAQNGTAATPDVFRSSVMYMLQNTCGDTTPGVDCPGGIDAYSAKVDAAVATYTAALAQANANAAAYFGANSPQVQAVSVPATVPASVPAALSPAAGSGFSVQLLNSSRPGQAFQVGDAFTVTITGAPANQQVTVSGTQNGQSKGTTAVGSTNSSGGFSLSGTMTPDTVGSWSETWAVGATPSSPVNYSVSAASSPSSPVSFSPAPVPASSSPSFTAPVPSSSAAAPPSSSSTSSTTPPASSSTTGFSLSTIMTNLQAPSPVFGLPWLAVIGIGALGLWWLSSRGKR